MRHQNFQRRVLIAVLTLAGAALGLDRFFAASPVTAPRPADASTLSSPDAVSGQPVLTSRPGSTVPGPLTRIESVAQRLVRCTESVNARDRPPSCNAFEPPASWPVSGDAGRDAKAPEKAPRPSAAFQPRLTLVMMSADGPVAKITYSALDERESNVVTLTRLLRVGDQCEGYTVTAIQSRRITFASGSRAIESEIPQPR